MPLSPLGALSETFGLASIDEDTIDAFLAPAPDGTPHRLLFFAGAAAERSETADVAIILPQLLRAFAGRLQAALVAGKAEAALKDRFHVGVFPSLVVLRGFETLGVLPKVYDWSDYLTRIEAMLQPHAPALQARSGPRVEFTYSTREAAR